MPPNSAPTTRGASSVSPQQCLFLGRKKYVCPVCLKLLHALKFVYETGTSNFTHKRKINCQTRSKVKYFLKFRGFHIRITKYTIVIKECKCTFVRIVCMLYARHPAVANRKITLLYSLLVDYSVFCSVVSSLLRSS